MIIPTARTFFLLVIGGAIATLLFSVNQAAAWLILLLFDGGILGVAFWDNYRIKPERVTITRQLSNRLSIGRDNIVTLTVAGAKRNATLQIYDTYPSSFEGSQMPLQITLSPEEEQTLTYSVFPNQRGEYDWKYIQLRQLSPWKLVWHDWKVPQAQTVEVYPDLIGLRSLTIRLTLETSGNMHRFRRLGLGTEFAELREYGIGDDPRLIDWKTTARRGHPFVKVLEPEQEQTLIILLDRGRLMTAQVQGLSRFDWGLNATLSLALAGLSRGDRVGVGVFDRQVHTWIPPQRGQSHLNTLLEKTHPDSTRATRTRLSGNCNSCG